MFHHYQDFAELVSLALTVPTIVLAVWVVWKFFPKALEGFTVNKPDAIQWFAMGITIGFIGSVCDNLYWSIPWTFSYLQSDSTEFLVKLGVFFNVVFRQLAGIAAAYCHIRCACECIDYDSQEVKTLNYVLAGSLGLGITFAFGLEAIR